MRKIYFNLKLYQLFLENIYLFKKDYHLYKTNPQYIKLRNKLIDTFFYITSALFYHIQKEGLFKIKNIDEIDIEIMSGLFSEFREITQSLLENDL